MDSRLHATYAESTHELQNVLDNYCAMTSTIIIHCVPGHAIVWAGPGASEGVHAHQRAQELHYNEGDCGLGT